MDCDYEHIHISHCDHTKLTGNPKLLYGRLHRQTTYFVGKSSRTKHILQNLKNRNPVKIANATNRLGSITLYQFQLDTPIPTIIDILNAKKKQFILGYICVLWYIMANKYETYYIVLITCGE